MRIVSWNVNSIRARIDLVTDWVADQQPDVLCLQETKCKDGDFPYRPLQDLGYEVAHHGIDQWNGVAIVSRVGLDDVQPGFLGAQLEPFHEARVIAATCGDVRTWSIYAPNGRALDDPHYLFKLVWFERLRAELMITEAPARAALVVGDFNVAPADIDIYDPKRWKRRTHASPQERAAYRSILDLGFHDLAREWAPDDPMFTWWNYLSNLENDKGLRIDLALGSASVRQRVVGVGVDRLARSSPRPSDHAPLVVLLS